MIIPVSNEIAFQILGFPVYWYGIVLAIAVFVGILVADKLLVYRNIKYGLIIDYSPLFIFFGIIGARLYYCLLNYLYYFDYPIQILNIRQGGLSIHGMIIFAILLIYFITKKHKIQFLALLDVLACALPLSQSIGRWGNYFNAEAFGLPTYSDWGLFVPLVNRPEKYCDYSLFHPTFLYESVLDLFLFISLFYVLRKFKKNGLVFFLYLIFYSIIRFFVEAVRIDSAMDIAGIHIAQIVSVIFIVIGLFGMMYIFKKAD